MVLQVALLSLFFLLLVFRAVLLLALVHLHTHNVQPLHTATHSKDRSQKQVQQEQLLHLCIGRIPAAPAGPAGAAGAAGFCSCWSCYWLFWSVHPTVRSDAGAAA